MMFFSKQKILNKEMLIGVTSLVVVAAVVLVFVFTQDQAELVAPVFASDSQPYVVVNLERTDLNVEEVLAQADIKLKVGRNKIYDQEDFNFYLKKDKDTEYRLEIEPKNKNVFRPGRYTVLARFETPQGVRDYSQDFYWGVLALNTNKSVYLPGEQGYLQMGVLDDKGNTLCDAELELRIKSPQGKTTTLSNTKINQIINNPLCGPNNVIDEPDYYVYYDFSEVGVYEMELTAITENGVRELLDYVEVKADLPFEVERIGPTRVYPEAQYEMKFKIKANRDFSGTVSDFLPENFEIIDSEVVTDKDQKQINWQVDWQAGQSYELNYTLDPPDISPQFYLLGPLEIGDWQEERYWQIANDAGVVEAGIIVAWPLTDGLIPDGWTRVATLDGYYLEGTTSDPSGDAGGNATHSHPQASHQHTIDHTHTANDVGAAVESGIVTKQTGVGAAGSGHGHSVTVGTATDNNNSVDTNFGSASNDPPYAEVIWIESDGTTGIPDGALAFFNDTAPTNWTATSTQRFLKGATGPDGDGGAWGGEF